MTRPSEALSAIVGTVIGALLIVVSSATKVEVAPEVSGAIVILVSYVAWAVTAYVASRQRKGEVTSASDGAVHS